MNPASPAPGSNDQSVPKACVIGWPIEHSRSPLIHNYWLKRYGLAGVYTKQAVQPQDVSDFLGSLAVRGLRGCNVTLPHKRAALAAAAHKEASAVAIGAANTLWLDDGKLCAANTDTYGFMHHLTLSAPGWERIDAPVVVLGAGGAARAVVFGLLEAGVEEVRLFNRTAAHAEALAQHFGSRVKALDWSQRETQSKGAGLLVNTTMLGMAGAQALDMSITALNRDAVVVDVVYVPLETQLLRNARAQGLRAVDGLGMLLHQAVPGFAKWFGTRPEVTDELRALLVANLEGR